MATLLIILLGTVLIQGSAIAAGSRHQQFAARGIWTDEVRHASFTLLTITLASVSGYLLSHHVLLPLKLAYLQTPVLLLAVTSIFFISRTLLDKVPGAIRWPDLLAHLTTQSALLGMALFSATTLESVTEALGYGIGAAVLLAILSSTFTALRERIDTADVPITFRGIPIALITAGFMALALLGLSGMVRN